jgi:hypothetical protein
MQTRAFYPYQVFQLPRFRFTIGAVIAMLALSVALGFLLQVVMEQTCITRLTLMWSVGVLFWLGIGPHVFRHATYLGYAWLAIIGITILAANQAIIYVSVPALMYLLHGCQDQYNHWITNSISNSLLVNGLCFVGFVVAGRGGSTQQTAQEPEVKSREKEREMPFIPVKYGSTTLQIEVSTVYLLEVEHNCITLYSESGKHVLYRSLSSIEKILPAYFIRVHRSHVVNKLYVQKLSNLPSGDAVITLRNGLEVRMSRTYKKLWKQ